MSEGSPRTPGRFWRDAIMLPGRDPEAFRREAVEAFRGRGSLFGPGGLALAVAALASGELDAAPVVLETLPQNTTDPTYFMGRCLAQLLPLPGDLDGRRVDDREAIAQWIASHRGRLVWSDDAERFELAP